MTAHPTLWPAAQERPGNVCVSACELLEMSINLYFYSNHYLSQHLIGRVPLRAGAPVELLASSHSCVHTSPVGNIPEGLTGKLIIKSNQM